MSMDVLIVDDSMVMRNLIKRSLRQAELPVTQTLEAGDGVQALALLEQHSVDLVFSDVNMPSMNGLEFISRARALNLPRPVPIVMVTTEGSTAMVSEALSRGANGHLAKPFTPEKLREEVLRVLG